MSTPVTYCLVDADSDAILGLATDEQVEAGLSSAEPIRIDGYRAYLQVVPERVV